jgi:hypothetical protein
VAKFRVIVLALTTIVVITTKTTAVEAQCAPVSTQSASITISLAVDKDRIPLGQSPWAILTIKNLTGHELDIHDDTVRVHVEDEKGERPTTPVQRSITGKVRAGDPFIPGDEQWLWSIAPGASSQHKYLLSFFYDLSAPGNHTVYIDILDPMSHRWMRTNTAKFKMEAPKTLPFIYP